MMRRVSGYLLLEPNTRYLSSIKDRIETLVDAQHDYCFDVSMP